MNQNEIYAINHNFINETVINIYLSYTSYIYIYLLYIFTHYKQKLIKPYGHQDFYVETQWLGRKPRKLHDLQNLLCQDSTLAGATTPYNLLEENTDSFNTILLFGTNREGHQPL